MKVENKNLHDILTEYKDSQMYPFHMPGHKRNVNLAVESYGIDMTEVDGVDNLHHPEGVLLYERKRIARLYNAKHSFILVGGSTVGNLAAIYAATKEEDEVLIQRNSHKSVYHGLMISRVKASYIFPDMDENGIYQAVTAKQVSKAFNDKKTIKAVIITSPTYEGKMADIAAIADICHRNKALLIVDSAHGAHLGIYDDKSIINSGADIVIMSLHKTLPALTQTALLHICSDRVSEDAIQQALDIFETSSPSYVLMDSVSSCITLLENSGAQLFKKYIKLLDYFYEKTLSLKHLSILDRDDSKDDGKLVILTNGYISGPNLADILREKYMIETEMSSTNYVLAMTSVMDTEEGIERLIDALYDIDNTLDATCIVSIQLNTTPIIVKNMYEMKNCDGKYVPINSAQGFIAKDEVCIYPPGSPLVVPGEEVTQEVIDHINNAIEQGLNVTGIHSNNTLFVADI